MEPRFFKTLIIYFCIQKIFSLRLKYTLTGVNGTIRSLAELDNGYLASGSDDYTLGIWDLKNPALKYSFNHTKNDTTYQIRTLINLGNNYLASGSNDGLIRIWSFSDKPELIAIFNSTNNGHTDAVLKLILFNNFLISCSADQTIKLWNITDIRNIHLSHTLYAHSKIISSILQVSNDLIASASYDRSIKIWNIDTLNLNFTFNLSNGGHENPVLNLEKVGNILVSSSFKIQDRAGDIKVFDLIDQKLKYTFDINNGGHDNYIFELKSLENTDYVASAAYDGLIKIWDIKYGRLKSTLVGHKDAVWSLIYLGNNLLVSGGGDENGTIGELNVWNILNQSLVYSFDKQNGGHSKRIYSFLRLNNGDLVSGSVDHTIKIWDTNKN